MLARLRAMAGPSVRFTERLSFDDLRKAYAKTCGLVFTAEEDFGLIPLEVMASGRPVLALGKGGALETVVAGVTGQFYHESTEEALLAALDDFELWLPLFRPAQAQAHAAGFSPARFRAAIADEVDAACARHHTAHMRAASADGVAKAQVPGRVAEAFMLG